MDVYQRECYENIDKEFARKFEEKFKKFQEKYKPKIDEFKKTLVEIEDFNINKVKELDIYLLDYTQKIKNYSLNYELWSHQENENVAKELVERYRTAAERYRTAEIFCFSYHE